MRQYYSCYDELHPVHRVLTYPELGDYINLAREDMQGINFWRTNPQRDDDNYRYVDSVTEARLESAWLDSSGCLDACL